MAVLRSPGSKPRWACFEKRGRGHVKQKSPNWDRSTIMKKGDYNKMKRAKAKARKASSFYSFGKKAWETSPGGSGADFYGNLYDRWKAAEAARNAPRAGTVVP